jgi:hypothetical protein
MLLDPPVGPELTAALIAVHRCHRYGIPGDEDIVAGLKRELEEETELVK